MSSATSAQPRPQVDDSAPTRTGQIDTDVHPGLGSQDLAPYLDEIWRPYVLPTDGAVQWGLRAGSDAPYARPHGHGRREWLQPDGSADSHDVPLSVRHLFDEEGDTHVILTGMLAGTVMRTDPEFAVALCKAFNDCQVEKWLDADERFMGSVHVYSEDPEAAAAEIDRMAAHPRIVAVTLPTVTDRQWGAKRYWPIFEAAVRNDLAVTLHHGSKTQTAVGYPEHFIEWHTLAPPQASMSQVASILSNGLFDRYPGLKLGVLECSLGWVPWFMARLDQQYREMRSTVPWVKKLPSEHMRRSVRFATQPVTELTTKGLTDMIRYHRLEDMFMFSTDYPHYDADSAAVLAGLSDDLKQKIFFENAINTYPRLQGLLK